MDEDGSGWIRMDLNPYQTTLGEPDQGSFTNKSIRCHHDVILEFLFKDLRKLYLSNQNALGCVEKIHKTHHSCASNGKLRQHHQCTQLVVITTGFAT